MFSWIPIHQEVANRLIEFRERQGELIAILGRMHAAGLKALPLKDQGVGGLEILMEEIDPFTFFSNFNRGNTRENRQALWAFLKKEWSLKADVPEDFDGIPVMNFQKSWFVPYTYRRAVDHVSDLWEFFVHIQRSGKLDTGLMQRCLDHRGTAMTILTMGMFWLRPETWISTDGKNIGFAIELGSKLAKPKLAKDYPVWLAAMRDLTGGDTKEFSRKAHLWGLGNRLGAPFDKLFGAVDPRPVFDLFQEVVSALGNAPGFKPKLLVTKLRQEPAIQVDYGDWTIFTYEQKGN